VSLCYHLKGYLFIRSIYLLPPREKRRYDGCRRDESSRTFAAAFSPDQECVRIRYTMNGDDRLV
jgi:hypothetical protein